MSPPAIAAARPKVYTIPPQIPFLEALAEGLLARHFVPDDPTSLSRATVLLPTRRAARALGEHLIALAAEKGFGRALILPEIRPLGDVDEEALTFGQDETAAFDMFELPETLPPLRRRLILARLVEAWGAKRAPDQGGGFSSAQSLSLAQELEGLIDRAETQDVPLDRLNEIVPAELAQHWDEVLGFLKIVAVEWPAIEAASGAIGPAHRRALLMAAQAAQWRAAPPDGPVIAAGSTGTIPATAALLGLVARLPQGAVLLPGLDQALDAQSWDEIEPSHPQGALKALITGMGLARDDVAVWPYGQPQALALRARLLNEALRPWVTTGGWRAAAPALKTEMNDPQSPPLALHRIDAPHQGLEAASIALILREALETDGQTAALVTPDRRLARAVRGELARWEIDVDDSAGVPLGETAPGVFLRLIAATADEGLAPVFLLALLKHPLARLGRTGAQWQDDVLALENILRDPRLAPGLSGLEATLERRRDAGERERLARLVRDLSVALCDLLRLFETRKPVSFGRLIEAHIAAAEALARSEAVSGAERLWTEDAGEAAATLLGQALSESAVLADHLPADYPPFLEALMKGVVVRPAFGRHPRLSIWGPLEARLQKADIVILGGLNEGVWPQEPASDPWMSRAMMSAVGLPAPEQRLGLSAHDFVQIAGAAKTAYLTRALKVDGAPTVASRWLTRLDTLLIGLGGVSLAPPCPWLDWARQLDAPAGRMPPIAAPRPAPPLPARPRSLRVTEIETLVRDPYAIYARHVLKLSPLEPLDAPPDAALRGTIAHEIMEAIAEADLDLEAPDALERLVGLGRAIFDGRRVPAEVSAFWWPRFETSAPALLAMERGFRQAGETPRGVEVAGTMTFDAPGGPFTLRARADRIDRAADGTLIIADYKTGVPPTEKQMKTGLAPQLPLEAMMAAKGGFGAALHARVSLLRVIRLMKSADPVEVTPIGDVDALAAGVEEAFLQMIARFDDPAYPYRSRPVPKFMRGEGAYDHLARVKEWSAGETGEGEG